MCRSSLVRPLRMCLKGKRVFLGLLCAILLMPLTGRYVAAQVPTIVIHEPVDGAEVSSQTIILRASITVLEGTSLGHYEVWVNGVPELWRDKGVDPVLPGEVSRDILLQQGENQIVVVAVDSLDQRREQAVTVVYKPSLVQKPDLYILAIGISDYERADEQLLNLSYADADARAIVDAFLGQKGRLFADVKTRLLMNEQALEKDIVSGLDWILSEVTENDLAVIFVSGHGFVHELRGDYYFLPHRGHPVDLSQTGVPWYEFDNVVKKLVGKTLFLADTCHSAGITGAKGMSYNVAALQDFATAGQGVMYMTSSTGNEVSKEHEKWGHGAFTKAVLKGLAGEADYNLNGVIDTAELGNYVTNQVKELTGGRQHPTSKTLTTYTSFPLFVLAQGPAPMPTQEPVEGTPRGEPAADVPTAIFTPMPGYDLYVRPMAFMQTNPAVGDTIDLSIMLATDIAPQRAAYYPASHFRWRQGANFPWQEEVCPDNYQYASCMKDVAFSYSQPGSYDVEVEADSRGSIAETDETNNTETWTITVEQEILPPLLPGGDKGN